MILYQRRNSIATLVVSSLVKSFGIQSAQLKIVTIAKDRPDNRDSSGALGTVPLVIGNARL